MQEKSYNLKENYAFLKKTYKEALIPCMIAVIGSNINILIDGIIIGQKLGVDGLATLNFCMPVYLTLCVIGSFLVAGNAISAAIAVGKNYTDQAQRHYHLSIGLCILISIIVTALGIIFINPLTNFLCPEEGLFDMVKTYTEITIWGSLSKIILYIPFWYLRIDGRNRCVMVVMCTMSGINIILDYILIFVFDKGMFGAAIASVIAASVAALVGFIYLSDKKSSFKLGIAFNVRKEEWSLIRKNGTPVALNNLTQTFRILCINKILALYGATTYVATFAAINCVSEFSLCLIQGIPQAALAMLGVYYGERDNKSIKKLLNVQWNFGYKYAIAFGVIIVALAQVIAKLYALDVYLYYPMTCLALGLFLAILNGILSGYYNISEKTNWANLLIFSRVFFFPITFLAILWLLNLSPWSFIFFGEVASLLLWLVCVKIYNARHKSLSRYLLIDNANEKDRKTIEFSVEGNNEAVCLACEEIVGFCEDNGISMKQTMRLNMAMEEVLVMIISANPEKEISFDLRLYANEEQRGIRIRYDGKDFNPFSNKENFDDSDYLGIRMIYNLVDTVIYTKTFGMNMLLIKL